MRENEGFDIVYVTRYFAATEKFGWDKVCHRRWIA